MKFVSSFSFLFLALCGQIAHAIPHYSVTDLGDFAGGEDYSQAFDLNASGQVVGVSQISSRFRAFLSSTGSGGEVTLVDLDSLPTLPTTRAFGVNSLGQIVGTSSDGDRTRAFLWNPNTPNGVEGVIMELFGLPGERNHATAISINGRGQVVGYSRGQAYLWTPDVPNGATGTAIDLGGFPGAIGSLALDINDSGQVAGISGAGTDRAFLWTPSAPNGTSGSMVDLGSLPGGSGASQGLAINAAGVVVGNSTTATGQHAVLWRPGSSGVSMVDLGVLAGGNDFSSATGVNSANQVVGNSNSPESDHAVLWTEADGMLDLNSLTDASGAAWILRYAQSINDEGQIVGWGTFDPDGSGPLPSATHAFRLEPVAETPPAKLANISTRVRVLPGDNALIGGFIITGTEPKKVIIRGLGPSLAVGVESALADPTIELRQGNVLLAQNDNWRDTQAAEILATTIQPANDLESAIVRTLDPGTYTAILRGRGETSGTGLVEVYDLGLAGSSTLANISTRGLVGTGDNVMIGGLIVAGDSSQTAKVIVRAIGPSLSDFGVPGPLQDPMLELHDSNGVLIGFNDNWRSDHETEIIAANLPPSRSAESALISILAPGSYTAIVRGVNATTGIGLIEAYNLP